MTVARQQRKYLAAGLFAKAAFFLALIAALDPLPASRASTTERVIVDQQRGLALSGFDPVAYFTNKKAMLGRGELEYSFAGATWRFRNDGNRAAFIESPDVYMPAFGGHDPVALARGVAAPGHPQIWTVVGARLYFFYDSAARQAFFADPEGIATAAEKKWPAVLHTLVP